MSNVLTSDYLPGRTITHEGTTYLFFSGTAYLGMQQHPAFQQLMAEALTHYGTAFGSSRNGNLRLRIYERAEEQLATIAGAPAALTLSSGMMAGQVIVYWLQSQGIQLCYAPGAHPALWTGPTAQLPDVSFSDWTQQLPEQLRAQPAQPTAILLNSLEAVRSVYYDFDWVNHLPTDRPITLVVDDSHGLGVLNDGRGIWPALPNRPTITRIVTASLAKAMGLSGGVVLSDTDTLAAVRKTAFFGACSPMAPAFLGAFEKALPLYTEGRHRLMANIALAEKHLLPTGLFTHAAGYPVFFTGQNDLYTYLLKAGILIYSFAYPTAADRANTRIVISAVHTAQDIETLADAVRAYVADRP